MILWHPWYRKSLFDAEFRPWSLWEQDLGAKCLPQNSSSMRTILEHASIQCLRALCFCHTYHASVTFKHSIQLFMHVVTAEGNEHICIFVNVYADGHITDMYTMCLICTEDSQSALYCGSDPSSKPPQFQHACPSLPPPPPRSYQLLTTIYFCHLKRSLFGPAYLSIWGLCLKLMPFWSIEIIKNTHNLWWTNKEPSICPLDRVQTQLSKYWKWRQITI